jgi:hypothetical protein
MRQLRVKYIPRLRVMKSVCECCHALMINENRVPIAFIHKRRRRKLRDGQCMRPRVTHSCRRLLVVATATTPYFSRKDHPQPGRPQRIGLTYAVSELNSKSVCRIASSCGSCSILLAVAVLGAGLV